MQRCHKCHKEGYIARNYQQREGGGTAVGSSCPSERPHIKCYNCGKQGHISMHYLRKANYFCGDGLGRSVARVGLVEGVAVSDILLDTGCYWIMVRCKLIPEDWIIPGEAVTMNCVHGDILLYSFAMVTITLEGVPITAKAAVERSLSVSLLV